MCDMTHTTGWRRRIACLKLQVIFRKRATNYRALLRKMTCKNKAPYGSLPPCREAEVDILKNERYSHMRQSDETVRWDSHDSLVGTVYLCICLMWLSQSWLSSSDAQVDLSQESWLQSQLEKQRYSHMIQPWLCKMIQSWVCKRHSIRLSLVLRSHGCIRLSWLCKRQAQHVAVPQESALRWYNTVRESSLQGGQDS